MPSVILAEKFRYERSNRQFDNVLSNCDVVLPLNGHNNFSHPRVYEQYGGISDPGAGVLHRAAFRFRLRDGIGQGLRHTLRLAMSPTESDRQIVRLPCWLTPLYVLVRPWRLLREYGSGLKRR